MEDVKKYLPELTFWQHLSDREKDFVSNNASVRHYKKGGIIHGYNDSCLGMIYVISGSMRIYILSEEGREVTLFRLERGDTCILSAACVISQITFETQMTAEKECELMIINSGAFGRLTEENIYVRCYMYELATERFSSVMWSMQQILFAKFDQRLAAFLISEYDRTGIAEIRMTHEQIAQQVSSAREVVARMLKRFASDGLVEVKRGSIILKNIDKLKNM